MADARNSTPPAPRRKKGGARKPEQGPAGQRVDPKDPVEEASTESFPASDPPAHSPEREGPLRPAGEKPEKRKP